MKPSTVYSSSMLVAIGTISLLVLSAVAAPVDSEDEQSENTLMAHSDGDDFVPAWDPVHSAALRKLLLQFDSDERLSPRVGRSWSQAEPRDWGYRPIDGRLMRSWRTAGKRQVRFRQCYFNPISCFRK